MRSMKQGIGIAVPLVLILSALPVSGWTEEINAEGSRVVRLSADEIPWVHYAKAFLEVVDDLRRLEAVQHPDAGWMYDAFLGEDLGIPPDAKETVSFVTSVLARFYGIQTRLNSKPELDLSPEESAHAYYRSVSDLYQELRDGLEARGVSTAHWPGLIRGLLGVSLTLIFGPDEDTAVDESLAYNRALLETPREAFQ